MLSEEEAKDIKSQLMKQVESFPSPQKESAKQQIESMNPEELEEFLIKNNLIKGNSEQASEKPQCVFCSIVNGKIASFEIGENKQATAVLDINPLSEGHTIVIPKEHVSSDKIPNQALTLAKRIAGKLKEKLKADSIEISTTNDMGHAIINIIPQYNGRKLEKKQATPEELKGIQDMLIKPKQKPKPKPIIKSEPVRLPRFPRRIP